MAKKSMIAREAKRTKMVAKYAAKRAELKEIIRSPNSSFEQVMAAIKLAASIDYRIEERVIWISKMKKP